MKESPGAVGDDGPVVDGESLYRRLSITSQMPLVSIDQLSGRRRPSSAAFKPNPKLDPDGLSVYRQRILAHYGLDTYAVQNDPRDLVASLVAADPRALELEVLADPQPDETGSLAPKRARAHALITKWPESNNQRSKLAKQLALAATIVQGGLHPWV